MGKQTLIALTEKDEAMFLEFLQSTAPIRIFRAFASSPELLEIQNLPPRSSNEWQFLISNENFPWEPTLGRVLDHAPVIEHRGWYYIADRSTAPAIEYLRHNFEVPHSNGRVYWAKSFASPDGLGYDITSFNSWYQKVVRWLRKNGHRHSNDPYSVYYLPDAWVQHGGKA